MFITTSNATLNHHPLHQQQQQQLQQQQQQQLSAAVSTDDAAATTTTTAAAAAAAGRFGPSSSSRCISGVCLGSLSNSSASGGDDPPLAAATAAAGTTTAAAASSKGASSPCSLGGVVGIVPYTYSRHQIGKIFGCSLCDFFSLCFQSKRPRRSSPAATAPATGPRKILRGSNKGGPVPLYLSPAADGDAVQTPPLAPPAAAPDGDRESLAILAAASCVPSFDYTTDDEDTLQQQQQQQQRAGSPQQQQQQRVGTLQQQQQQDLLLINERANRISYEQATKNFADSLAAYAILSYLLQV